MTPRLARLRKMCEFDVDQIKRDALDLWPYSENVVFLSGARIQHNRLQPILNALIECVDALDKIWDLSCRERVLDASLIAEEALAQLTRTLDGMEK